jgi:hypothetical protein
LIEIDAEISPFDHLFLEVEAQELLVKIIGGYPLVVKSQLDASYVEAGYFILKLNRKILSCSLI